MQNAAAGFLTGLDRSIVMGATCTIWARIPPESLPCDLKLYRSICCFLAPLAWGLDTDGVNIIIILIRHGRAAESKQAPQLGRQLHLTKN